MIDVEDALRAMQASGTHMASVVDAGGRVLGVLGVIGPTRMAYDRVIPVVQAAADALGNALNPDSQPS